MRECDAGKRGAEKKAHTGNAYRTGVGFAAPNLQHVLPTGWDSVLCVCVCVSDFLKLSLSPFLFDLLPRFDALPRP